MKGQDVCILLSIHLHRIHRIVRVGSTVSFMSYRMKMGVGRRAKCSNDEDRKDGNQIDVC